MENKWKIGLVWSCVTVSWFLNLKVAVYKEHLEAAQSMSDSPVLYPFIKPNDSSNPTGLSTSQLSLLISSLLCCLLRLSVYPCCCKKSGLITDSFYFVLALRERSGSAVKKRSDERSHLAVVACGPRLEETLTMLKSAVLLSKKPLRFYIFAEDDLHNSFRNAVSVSCTCVFIF